MVFRSRSLLKKNPTLWTSSWSLNPDWLKLRFACQIPLSLCDVESSAHKNRCDRSQRESLPQQVSINSTQPHLHHSISAAAPPTPTQPSDNPTIIKLYRNFFDRKQYNRFPSTALVKTSRFRHTRHHGHPWRLGDCSRRLPHPQASAAQERQGVGRRGRSISGGGGRPKAPLAPWTWSWVAQSKETFSRAEAFIRRRQTRVQTRKPEASAASNKAAGATASPSTCNDTTVDAPTCTSDVSTVYGSPTALQRCSNGYSAARTRYKIWLER